MNLSESSNYLKNPKDYIITGIYNMSNFYLDWRFFKRKNIFIDPTDFKNPIKWDKWYIKQLLKKWAFIDYYTENDYNDNFYYIGKGYVISKITDKPLYSTEYKDCTALVGIGRDKNTWKNIGFLTHQWPEQVLKNEVLDGKLNNKIHFLYKISNIIKELQDRCEPWTIDITFLGWRNDGNFKNYKKLLKTINKIVEKKLWFPIQISAWPSIYQENIDTSKNILVDIENRRILLFKEYSSPEENIDFCINQTNQALQQLLKINEKNIERITKILLNKQYDQVSDFFISQIWYILDKLEPKIFKIFNEYEIKKQLIPILIKQIVDYKEDKILIFKNNEHKLTIKIKNKLWVLKVKTYLD